MYLDLDQVLESLCNELAQLNGLTSLKDVVASWFSTRERIVEQIRRMWLASDSPIAIRGRPWTVDLELDEAIGEPEPISPHTDKNFHYAGDAGDLVRIYQWKKRRSRRNRWPEKAWGELAISEEDFKRLKGALAKTRKKSGPEPALTNKIKEKMIADLTSGKRTVEELKRDTLAALVSEYGGSANTADRAREEAMSDFHSSTLGQL